MRHNRNTYPFGVVFNHSPLDDTKFPSNPDNLSFNEAVEILGGGIPANCNDTLLTGETCENKQQSS